MVAMEIRQAIRSIGRTPLFAGVVVLLLALGIGANALIFTAVDALLLRPLPVRHPEQIVRLGVQRSPTHTSYEHPYAYVRVLRERARAFSDVFACGMLAYSVGQRTREIGIRVAVGATVGRIAWMIGRDAASAVAPGLVLGLAAYAACSRVVAALLYGVTRWDAVSIAGATACLIAVSVAATLFPAIRAALIQPSQALRDE
jgi:hypothetical protein